MENYEFVVYWFHTSELSSNGNKAKCNFYKEEKEALKFYNLLYDKMLEKKSYQQGQISHLTKNF